MANVSWTGTINMATGKKSKQLVTLNHLLDGW